MNGRKIPYLSPIILRKKDLARFSYKMGLTKIFIYSNIFDILIKNKLATKRKIIPA